MEIIQTNLHPKVLKNQLFVRATDWLIDNKKVGSQKELALITGINEPTLSNIRNDKKIVSDKTIRKLLDAFPGIFNPDYFRGQNVNMTMAELIEARMNNTNHTSEVDTSSLINAALASKDETIEDLKARITELRNTIADKIEIIKAREARITELERQLAAASTSDLSRYPFVIGTAEDNKQTKPL